ncbi:hypothetical protein BGZ61DRAFT_530698 [Ilyonectria robusta]|uniref:uncharacterized protein n=1 Tax=Ilyonectria robusta TaxID=1079257 RepID=UPI001E8D0646|nr:uncharacterized protein BGZ61DRAFT_530698 [Ilyonectria robusta]KAH8722254.1 hypothetical protein BGZ61DRAFT_530698 [Ilyonectria robusta]
MLQPAWITMVELTASYIAGVIALASWLPSSGAQTPSPYFSRDSFRIVKPYLHGLLLHEPNGDFSPASFQYVLDASAIRSGETGHEMNPYLPEPKNQQAQW